MSQNMISPSLKVGYVDKRRTLLTAGASGSARETGITIFTCNATGTTTTAKGADAVPATADTNVIRRGEKFKLFTAAGVPKEETIFRVTGLASAAGTTTVTFTPAAATAPVSTDVLKRVGTEHMDDVDDLDFRLNQLDGTLYSATNLDLMTANDKLYALRLLDDPTSAD